MPTETPPQSPLTARSANGRSADRKASGSGNHPQAEADRHVNEKVAGVALMSSRSKSASDPVNDPAGRSVASAGTVTIPNHVDYDLPPESVAGSSEP
jgi:hypothetical protein